MPTQRPRLTVTLTPAVDRALTAFSRASGTSKGAFILGVLEGSLPVLERLAVTAQAARRAQPEALAKIKQNIDQLERVALKALGGVETASDLFLEPLPAPARTGGTSPPGEHSTCALPAVTRCTCTIRRTQRMTAAVRWCWNG